MSDDTRDRVLAAVRELRYRPTALEQDQKAIRTRNLGVIVPDARRNPLVENVYLLHILDGILESAFVHSWSATLFVQRFWDDRGNAIRHRYDGRCDGLIIVAPQPVSEIAEALESLHKRGTPMVQIGSTPWLPDISHVDIDNVAAGRLAAEHLLALGHSKLAFVSLVPVHVASRERLDGFIQGAGSHEVMHFECGGSGPNFSEVARQILEMGDARPTGLFAWHDATALDLIRELEEVGLRIPDDVSVMGVDNAQAQVPAGIPLTTIDNPLHRIGFMAVDLLINQLEKDVLPQSIVLPATLIARASTGRPPQK